MSNLIKLVFVAALLFSSGAFALKSYTTCPKGWLMQGDIKNNNVWCRKAEVKRNNPVCGLKRYREDAVNKSDKCVKKNKPTESRYWTQPKCVKGRYRAVTGPDQCWSPTMTKKRSYCKTSWTMFGETSNKQGRGRVSCRQYGKKLKNPGCGLKRYRQDAVNKSDKCVKKNKPTESRYWTQPVCVKGHYNAVTGPDLCRSSYKRRHLWKR